MRLKTGVYGTTKGWSCSFDVRNMSYREPSPRPGRAAVGIGQKLYTWGGRSSAGIQSVLGFAVHSFDVPSVTWEEPQQFNGFLPVGLHSMAVSTDGESAYSFGGISSYNNICYDTLYEVNVAQSELRKLLPADNGFPPDTFLSGMVYFNEKLVIYGGYGSGVSTDELYVFDLKESKAVLRVA